MSVWNGRRIALLAVLSLYLETGLWSIGMVGLRPAVTVEPEYPQGVFDVNVVPFCAEFGIVESQFAVRFDLVCTVQLGGKEPVLENVGCYVGVPWYPFSKAGEPHTGFFAGPKVGLCRNLPGGFWATGPSIEMGWSFDLDDFALLACAEGGATLFLPDEAPVRWAGHGGVSCILGVQFREP